MKRLQDHKQKSSNKWPYKHSHIYPQRRAPSWASLKVDKTLRDFLVIPLNSQWETKINEKPCQIQVDIKGTLLTSTLKPTDAILGKLSEAGKG